MQEVYYRLDRESRIASLVIDTVGAVNTVGEQFITDLETATRRAAADRVVGIIIRSAKSSSFLDGADLAAIRKNPSPAALELLLRRYQAVLDALASNPFPVAAVLVEQTALGGGFELLLWACDRIFATPGSKMGLPEVNVGLFPAAGGLETLKRLVGFETALDIVLGGKVLGAHAFAISEQVEVIEADRIAAAAESWIRANPHITNRNMGSDRLPDDEKKACCQLIEKARKSHTRCRQRPWFDALLTAAQEALDLDFRQAVDNQIRHFAPLIADRNVQNKIDFFFTSTRVAPKLASVDAEQSIPVDRVAVIGAGLMGRGIAQVCADNELRVLLFDIDQQAAQHARDQIAGDLEP